MKKKILFVILFSVILISFTVTAQNSPEDPLKGFDQRIIQFMRDWRAPCIAVSVIKDGKVIYSKGFGYRDPEKKLLATPKTLFGIGSATKSITVDLIAILVDQGKLNWDKPIREYLPDFSLSDELASRYVTMRDFLSHRAGLPAHFPILYGAGLTRAELIGRLQYIPLQYEFRTQFGYQNLTFITAGYIAEKILGTRWEDAVKTLLFEPLGMSASNSSITDSQKTGDFAMPYKLGPGGDQIPLEFMHYSAGGPAMSVNSNLEDLSKWLLMHLNKGRVGNKQIISEKTIEERYMPVIPIRREIIWNESLYSNYGLGWYIAPYRGHLLVYHYGATSGFTSLVTFAPGDNMGIVVLTNMANSYVPNIISSEIYDRLFGLPTIDWSKRISDFSASRYRELAAKQREELGAKKTGAVPSHPFQSYTGIYEHPGYGFVDVRFINGKLAGTLNNKIFTLEHIEDDRFTLVIDLFQIAARTVFKPGQQGIMETGELQFDDGSIPIEFKRIQNDDMKEEKFLTQFVGKYRLGNSTLSVTVEDGANLMIVFPGRPKSLLIPYKGTQFHPELFLGTTMEFIIENNKVTKILIKQPNGTFEADRIE